MDRWSEGAGDLEAVGRLRGEERLRKVGMGEEEGVSGEEPDRRGVRMLSKARSKLEQNPSPTTRSANGLPSWCRHNNGLHH